jgi:N-acyl-D-amino-acid deacylase
MPFDLVIRGATIYDGSGLPGFVGDVAVQDGRLAEVGGRPGPARREIQAAGLAVAPGFIDSHTHLDAQLLWDPFATSCFHGVTSVVTGNCGLSLMPCKPENRETLLGTFSRVEGMEVDVLRSAVPWSWSDTAGYLAAIGKSRPSLNVGVLVGHCALRQHVMGEASVERAASDDEIRAMQQELDEAIRAGALGFSTNQNARHFRADGKPVPTRLAEPAEIQALGDVLGRLGRGVIQMSLAPGGTARIDAIADLSLRIRRPVVWNTILHFWSNPDLWRQQLEATARAFERGARPWANTNVRAFNNRFTMRNSQEFDEFPTWRALLVGPMNERVAAFRDRAIRAKLRWEAVEDPKPATFHKRWDLVYILKPARPHNARLRGRSVADVAREQGKDVLDAFLDLALEEDLDTVFQTALTNGDLDAVGRIVASPYTVLGQSDAGAHLAVDAGFGYCTELLATFVRERRALSLEEAIRKLTWMQARIFAIPDRGLLATGMAADLVVFDPRAVAPREPELVHDLPGGAPRLIQHADGIRLVVVNGAVVLEDGAHTGARPGSLLR